MAKAHKAFRIENNDSEKILALVWWDGERIRCSSESWLKHIKKAEVPFRTSKQPPIVFGDGEKFFDLLPHTIKDGYVRLKSTKVDESGKEV